MAEWQRQKEAAVDPKTVPPPTMTAAKKRELITHLIGDCHEQLVAQNAFEGAFQTTGTVQSSQHAIYIKTVLYPEAKRRPCSML